MSTLPVGGIRVSNMLTHQRLISQVHSDEAKLQKLFDQLSTGRRFTRPGENPKGAIQALLMKRGIDHTEQLIRNADSSLSNLGNVDATLQTIFDEVASARATATTGVSNLLSKGERESLADTVAENIRRIVALSNTETKGQYLLRGGQNDYPPLTYDAEYVRLEPTRDVGRSIVDGGRFAPYSSTASAALGAGGVTVTGTADLDPTLDASAKLADLRGGRGVESGVVQLAGNDGEWVEVDLSATRTIGDIIDALDGIELDGREIDVRIAGDRLEIAYLDGLPGTLSIRDLTGDSLTQDLGIANPLGLNAPPLQSNDLEEKITSDTLLSRVLPGGVLDIADGIQIRQGTKTYDIALNDAETIGDVLSAFNRSGADVVAGIDENANRLTLSSLRSGVDFSVGELGGLAATNLGLRTGTGSTELADLDHGRGFLTPPEPDDFVIRRPDGFELAIDLSSAETIDDVISAIDTHPDNQNPATRIEANLAATGNGIVLSTAMIGGELSVHDRNGNNVGKVLGLIAPGSDSSVATPSGAEQQIVGSDFAAREPDGILDVMVRLQEAIRVGDSGEIERLQGRLDTEMDVLYEAQANVALRAQQVEASKGLLEQQLISYRSTLSDEMDTDFADVVSQLTNQQAAFEASMRLIGQTAQMSVLNFI